MAKIRIEHVRKVFAADESIALPGLREARHRKNDGPQVALDGVDLLVHDGETMAVLGP